MQRAKRLLEGLRIHHLGFGFFWTVTFIVLAGFQGAGAIADYWQIYILTEQTLMPLAVGALGTLCAFRRCELPHWTASAASFMLSGAALLYFLAFHFGQGGGVIAAAAGILMGGSCTLFFLLWEMFYVTEGQQRALICIPLSAAMSVGLYLLICLLPSIAVALTAVCVLPFLALLCLQKSLAEIEADATAPCPKTRRGRPMAARALHQYPRVFVEAHRWHRAGPKLRRRRGARRFRGGGPFGGGPRAVSLEGLRHPAYLPGALPRARSRWPSCS